MLRYLLLVILVTSLNTFADTPGLVCEQKTVTVCPGEKVVVVKKKKVKKSQPKVEAVAISEKVVTKERVVVNKNKVILGVKEDVVGSSAKTNGNKVSVQTETDIVLSVKYIRMLNNNVGIGLGVDTTEIVEGLLSYEF